VTMLSHIQRSLSPDFYQDNWRAAKN